MPDSLSWTFLYIKKPYTYRYKGKIYFIWKRKKRKCLSTPGLGQSSWGGGGGKERRCHCSRNRTPQAPITQQQRVANAPRVQTPDDVQGVTHPHPHEDSALEFSPSLLLPPRHPHPPIRYCSGPDVGGESDCAELKFYEAITSPAAFPRTAPPQRGVMDNNVLGDSPRAAADTS